MKKYLIFFGCITLGSKGFSQLAIQTGTVLSASGNTAIVVNDLNIINNGVFNAGNSTVKFTGAGNNSIGGSSSMQFYTLETAKTASAKVSLQQNIGVGAGITFVSGFIDLNNKNIVLQPAALLTGESETSRIAGATGGYVEITTSLNAPAAANPGNLGAIITSAQNLGSTTIRRGHAAQSNVYAGGSTVLRYFDIAPANNTALNATLRLQYFDAELNSLNENNLTVWKSTSSSTWANTGFDARNGVANYVEKAGIPNFSAFTLSTAPGAALPVTSLELYAKRINAGQVQLDFKTIQEINNKGFHIERKRQEENSFAAIGFVATKASGGNSSFPLGYQYTDNNIAAGNTLYRLRQEDLDGTYKYSVVRIVKGEVNNQLTMQVWPVPAVGYFNVNVNGLEKQDVVQVFDVNGRLVKSFAITAQTTQQVSGLKPGTYFVVLAGDKTISQKVIVQ